MCRFYQHPLPPWPQQCRNVITEWSAWAMACVQMSLSSWGRSLTSNVRLPTACGKCDIIQDDAGNRDHPQITSKAVAAVFRRCLAGHPGSGNYNFTSFMACDEACSNLDDTDAEAQIIRHCHRLVDISSVHNRKLTVACEMRSNVVYDISAI